MNDWAALNAHRRKSRLDFVLLTSPATPALLPPKNVIPARETKLVPVARKLSTEGSEVCRAEEGGRSEAKKGREDRIKFQGSSVAAPSTRNGSVGASTRAYGGLSATSDVVDVAGRAV